LQVAPSAYRRHAARRRNADLRSARAKRDEVLMPEIERVWQANLQVYGADKVWKQLNREAIPVARCSVERLMRRLGLQGARRGKTVRTTVPDRSMPCPLDRVNRQFKADRPNKGTKETPTHESVDMALRSEAAKRSRRRASRCRVGTDF
jgi:putative transposase